ncbi:MAG: hypothetical protein F4165_00385, partial [Acidimicrobiia bacterium]|nr:hypothetical protein [Acidimicrobiia bacterium]
MAVPVRNVLLRAVAALSAVLALAAGAAIPAAASVGSGAPAAADIAARDELVAAQESLLNVYRCRFGIDTEAVPGGCADGKPAAAPEPPGRFAGTPAAADIAARDELVAAQESLLNVYRCRFGIDTEAVPGGCRFGKPASPAAPLTAISAGGAYGGNHSCGIRADQTIACWGSNGYGQSDAPAGQFTAIAAGGWHSCAIKTDQ